MLLEISKSYRRRTWKLSDNAKLTAAAGKFCILKGRPQFFLTLSTPLQLYYTINSCFFKQNRYGIKKTSSVINVCTNKEVWKRSTLTPNHTSSVTSLCILMVKLIFPLLLYNKLLILPLYLPTCHFKHT